MAETTHTTSGTEVPSQQSGAFPPFDTTTYAAQLFWLTVTFVLLLVVMWRLGVKRIGSNIDERKSRVAGDLAAAEVHRQSAEKASADYEAALVTARARAQAMAEDNHKRIQAEVDGAKAKAEAEAQAAQSEAEARIASVRTAAKAHVSDAARDAAIAIVARLIGENVSTDDAAQALGK